MFAEFEDGFSSGGFLTLLCRIAAPQRYSCMDSMTLELSPSTFPGREQANHQAVQRMVDSDPVLVDVRPALEAVPGMTPETILTSGAPLAWEHYSGGQRNAIIGGAIFEALAPDPEVADRKLRSGEITLGACHDYGCIGSLAGIYTASMPVFVVENRTFGNVAYCNSFEGASPKRLNYGVYDQDVECSLRFLHDVIAPVLRAALRRAPGGIPLRPLIRRALNMGDELHSRNAAATLLFTRELFPFLLEIERELPAQTRETISFISGNDYFFLRLSMAASKATADAARDVPASTVVSAMTFSCSEFAIRVSGLGDEWFRAPMPMVRAKLFDGYREEDIQYMGGESTINETVGLGGFAQAAAFSLQDYQGGSPEQMLSMNRRMYEITVGEHPVFKIPALGFRGVPVGIDVVRVLEKGILPVMDIGVAGRQGGQIGAGVLTAPLECFERAMAAYTARYGESAMRGA